MDDQDPLTEGTVEDSGSETSATGGHPAWGEILNAVPTEFHDALRPTLEKWDKGVQDRFQSLHSKYKPLEVFQDYDPEVVNTALAFMEKVETDPRSVWETMSELYGFKSEQGAEETVSEPTGFFNEEPAADESMYEGLPPEVASQLRAQQEQIAQLMQTQQQFNEQQENARLEGQLNEYMEWLHQEKGDFDDDFVVALLANGVSGEDAVDRYNQVLESAITARGYTQPPPPAPVIVSGSGGGFESNRIDPVKLTDSQTKDLVAQMLEQSSGA